MTDITEFYYSFKRLNVYNYDLYEFGIPLYAGMSAHKISDDTICISYQGNRIYEVHSNESCYFVLPFRFTQGVLNRWLHISNNQIHILKKRRKNILGLVDYELLFRFRKDGSWGNKATVYAAKRVQIFNEKGEIDIKNADPSMKSVTKNTDKYKIFNVALKQLKTTLTVQAKLGVYNDFMIFNAYSLSDFSNILGVTGYINYNDSRLMLYGNVMEWIETRDPSILKRIALLAMRLHSSGETKAEANIIKRLNSALKYVQATYLRDHCVTISESQTTLRSDNEPDDNDKDSELLQTAGLREVQVPSEAQVC